ncbi:hypothetical protein C8J57DRAFT_1231192 [Mycena rebaudengoi]|nr:hypothetical protein C8J57DRAFT_1231192 [Mycena rebaudengoi]
MAQSPTESAVSSAFRMQEIASTAQDIKHRPGRAKNKRKEPANLLIPKPRRGRPPGTEPKQKAATAGALASNTDSESDELAAPAKRLQYYPDDIRTMLACVARMGSHNGGGDSRHVWADPRCERAACGVASVIVWCGAARGYLLISGAVRAIACALLALALSIPSAASVATAATIMWALCEDSTVGAWSRKDGVAEVEPTGPACFRSLHDCPRAWEWSCEEPSQVVYNRVWPLRACSPSLSRGCGRNIFKCYIPEEYFQFFGGILDENWISHKLIFIIDIKELNPPPLVSSQSSRAATSGLSYQPGR